MNFYNIILLFIKKRTKYLNIYRYLINSNVGDMRYNHIFYSDGIDFIYKYYFHRRLYFYLNILLFSLS